MPRSIQTVFRTDWRPVSGPPSPAQADPTLHKTATITPAKREIAKDATLARITTSRLRTPSVADRQWICNKILQNVSESYMNVSEKVYDCTGASDSSCNLTHFYDNFYIIPLVEGLL